MALISALVSAALALMLFFIAAMWAGVISRLFRRGFSAADEAYLRGDSIAAWWNPKRPLLAIGSARLDQRYAMAGRKSRDFGTVMVEERASQPRYGR